MCLYLWSVKDHMRHILSVCDVRLSCSVKRNKSMCVIKLILPSIHEFKVVESSCSHILFLNSECPKSDTFKGSRHWKIKLRLYWSSLLCSLSISDAFCFLFFSLMIDRLKCVESSFCSSDSLCCCSSVFYWDHLTLDLCYWVIELTLQTLANKSTS